MEHVLKIFVFCSKQIIILEDSDTVESIEKEDEDLTRNTIYTKEIFTYLRQREVGI